MLVLFTVVTAVLSYALGYGDGKDAYTTLKKKYDGMFHAGCELAMQRDSLLAAGNKFYDAVSEGKADTGAQWFVDWWEGMATLEDDIT